jgi:hypothetical protein
MDTDSERESAKTHQVSREMSHQVTEETGTTGGTQTTAAVAEVTTEPAQTIAAEETRTAEGTQTTEEASPKESPKESFGVSRKPTHEIPQETTRYQPQNGPC